MLHDAWNSAITGAHVHLPFSSLIQQPKHALELTVSRNRDDPRASF